MRRQDPDKRSFTPEGFEFATTTPRFVYHFPVPKVAAKVYKGTWLAENADEIKPNYEIASAEIVRGKESVLYFRLTKPKNDWPAGLYRLEIRGDGKLIQTVRFTVVAP